MEDLDVQSKLSLSSLTLRQQLPNKFESIQVSILNPRDGLDAKKVVAAVLAITFEV